MSTITIRSRIKKPRGSDREIKGALVETGRAGLLAPNFGAEHTFEHVLLEPRNDRVLLEQIQNRRMAFENLGTALFFLGHILRHVTFLFPLARQPLGAVDDCL